MHPDFQHLMHRATQLTQAGDLTAATAAIQAALRNGLAAAPARQDDADVIDVEAWEVPDTAQASSAAPHVAGDAAQSAPKPAAAGDTFTAGSFRNSSGQRAYKLYVPPNPDGTPRPLVVMLHGCTQDADDFAAGTAMNAAAREQGFHVLYPVQSRDANPQKCWNWFKHNHQQPGRGEPSILAGMTREVIAAHNIDPTRVYVAGLSAGGAMAAILAGAYPELYAAAGVHSGLAAGAATDLPSALSAMKGVDRDATVNPANAGNVIAASVGPNARVETVRVAGAGSMRDSTQHVYRDAAGNIVAERWDVHGAGHAWAGGSEQGSYTDRTGPDATAEMLRFFFARTSRAQ